MGIGFKKKWERRTTAWMKISQQKIVYFPTKTFGSFCETNKEVNLKTPAKLWLCMECNRNEKNAKVVMIINKLSSLNQRALKVLRLEFSILIVDSFVI